MNKRTKKEMSLKDFETILLKIKNNSKIRVVKLLGGEPTLHSHFKEIVDLSLKYFPKVQIFTNGIFSDTLIEFLIKKTPKIGFTFNITTPDFLLNPQINRLVLRRIEQLSKRTKVTLSLTYDMHTDINLIFNALKKEILSQVAGFRLGFSNPIVDKKNNYLFEELPKMGKKTFQIVNKIRGSNQKARISLNCGFTRCMFTNNQFNYLKKEKVIIPGFGCFGKEASFDLQADLNAFHCFPLSTKNKVLAKRKNFKKVYGYFLKKQFLYWNKFKQEACLKCLFYGFEKNKCPGPCIAFLMNQSRNISSQ